MLLQSIYIKYDTNGKTLVKFWVPKRQESVFL